MKNNHESKFVEKPHKISDELVDKILAKYSNNFFGIPINVGNGIQINQFGISSSEAKDLFFVLFDNNFPKLQKIAEETARNCVISFRERFFYLASEYLKKNDLDAFKEPDLQYVLFRAIESSARFDSENLRSVLSSLLIRRIKAKEEELKKILYNEAITTVGKLSINQLKILTLHYLLYEQVFFIEPISWEELERFYTEKVTPFLDFRDTTADFSYLDYCGCCSANDPFGPTSYAQIIKNQLKFLFPELDQEKHEQAYIEDVIRKNLTLGDYLINLWSSTDIWALDLTAVGMVIVEAFYESYTGDRGFIKLEHIFNNKR
jgi:hypothetical protein